MIVIFSMKETLFRVLSLCAIKFLGQLNTTEVTMETQMAIFSFLAYENSTKMPNIAIQSP